MNEKTLLASMPDLNTLKDNENDYFESGDILKASDLNIMTTGIQVNQNYIIEHDTQISNLEKVVGAPSETETDTHETRIAFLENIVGSPDSTETNTHETRIDNLETSNASKPGLIITNEEGNVLGEKFNSATTADGKNSHAEGDGTHALGDNAHAEGSKTTAKGAASHAEGNTTMAEASNSHAEGFHCNARGANSHAEGRYTDAGSQNQHVQGTYNIIDTDKKYAHIVGNGTGEDGTTDKDGNNLYRSNAHTLTWTGDTWYAGNGEFEGYVLGKNGLRFMASVNGETKLFELVIYAAGNGFTLGVEEIPSATPEE